MNAGGKQRKTATKLAKELAKHIKDFFEANDLPVSVRLEAFIEMEAASMITILAVSNWWLFGSSQNEEINRMFFALLLRQEVMDLLTGRSV